MMPREIQRDACGFTRLTRIEHADQLIARARLMAAACVTDFDRGFSDFSDDYCTECFTRQECGLHVYEDTLFDAAEFYEKAGLVLLATRVRKITEMSVATAWQQFDEANMNPEL